MSRYYEENKKKKKKESQPTAGSPYDRAINSSYKSSYKEDNESPYQRAMAKMNGSYRPQGNITTTPPSNPTTTGESAYQRAMARLKGTTETQPIGNSKAIELNRKHYEDKRKENQPSVKPMASGNLANTQAAKLNKMALTDEEIAQKKAETGIFNKGYKKYGTDKLKDHIDKFTMSEEDSIKARDITSSKRYEEALENAIKDKGLTKEEADRVMANNGSVPYAAYKEYYKEELANSPMEKQLLKYGNDKNVGSKFANAMVNYDLNSAEDRADRATTREYEQSRIRSQEDFLDRNQYEEDKSYLGNEDYDAVNNNLNAGTISDQLYEGSHLTMEQRQNYNYVYNTAFDDALAKAREWTSDEEEAQRRAAESAREEGQKYLDMVHADEARTDYFNEFSREYAEKHPFAATATSIALQPFKVAGQIDNAFNYLTGRPNDENSLANLSSQMSGTMRGTVRNNIDSDVGKFLYDVGTSMGDMAVSHSLGLGSNNASLGIMGASAANDTYTQLMEAGYSATDATVLSAIAGGAEILTEKIPLDEIFSTDKAGFRQMLRAAFSEGAEEVASDVINDVADIVYLDLIKGGESQFDREVQAYMAKGMSEYDARMSVLNDHLNQAVYDFAAGAGSGGAMNVMNSVANKAQIEYNQAQAEYEAVKNLDKGARNVLLNLAETSSDEKTQKMAEKVKATEGKKRNVYDTAQVIKRVIEENNIDTKIENDLKAEGVKKKDIATAKAAIEKSIAEVDLTDEEYNLIQTEPVKKVLTGIAEGNLDATYERQLAVNDAIELARNGGKTTQTQNVTPSTETTENGAETNVESADESKKVVALSNYARNAQQRLGTMPIESLNDIQDVVNDEEGNIQIVTNDGNKVNNPYVKNRALGVVISNATTLFNDGSSAKAYIQNFDPAMNLKAYNTITTEMIKAGKADAGTDKSTLISTVKSLQNMGGDVGYYAKKLPASFFNDMYAYGVKEENQRSEVVASDPQRNVVNAIANQFSKSGLNITIEDNNTDYNGKLVGTNNLVLSSHADKALMSVLSHELTHYFKKKTNLYNDYEKAVIDFLKESGQYEELVEAKKKQGYADNEIDEEIVADAAENFLSDKKVIDRVCKNDKNLANKIISWLNQTIKDLKKLFGSADPRTAEGRIMKNLEKQNLAKYEEIRDLWVNAYEAATKADSSIDFSKEANIIKYSFASYMAEDYNKEEFKRVDKLLDEGKSDPYIFKNTGWFRGADGKWRFEISDADMKVYPRGDAKYLNDKDYQRYKELENKLLYENVSQEEYEGFRDEFDTLFNKYLIKKDLRLDDVITHDKLFNSYPTLRLVRVSFERFNGAKEGTYKPVENKIVVDEKYKMDIKGLKKVLLHEMQHAIQRMESMSPGATVGFYENPLVQVKDTVEYDKYKYLQKEMKGILDSSEDFKNQYEVYDNLLKEFSKTQDESYLDKANKIEEKLYDKYPGLMDRYQNMEFEYMLAKDNLVRKDLASELYYMTAGEIEARDTEDRSELTEEERREKYPTTRTENGVVFSDRLEYEPAEKFSMKQPSEELGNIEQKAVEHFGTTENFRTAGYMLTDGTLLDFSGAHWLEGESPEYIADWKSKNDIRQVDHEDIYEVMEASGDNRKQFMDRGNIRLSPEAPGFNISAKVEPTDAQYRELKEFIREIKKNPYYDASRFYVDIEDTHPNKITYSNNLNEDRIINDIKKFYETGSIPEQSSLNDFRYSIKQTTDGRDVAVIDKDILKGVPENQWTKVVADTIRNTPAIVVGNDSIAINSKSQREYIYSKYTQWLKKYEKTKYYDKLKAANNIGDIILASDNWVNEASKHGNYDSFGRGKVLLRIGNNSYIADVVVGITGKQKKMAFYDVVSMQPTKFQIKKEASSIQSKLYRSEDTSFDKNISSSEQNVNNSEEKYSKKLLDDIGVKLSNKYTDADEMFFSEDTWENSEAQNSAKNTADILKEGFNNLQKLRKAGKAHFTHADALRLAEKYQREYGTSTGKEYIANNIESIFAYIENNRDNVRYDDMLRVMRDAAMPIVEKQSNELDEYDDFRKYVKDLNISLNDQQRAEVINTYGSMKTFRKAIGSRINVTEDGQNIDSLWQDICEASGYYLDPDENSNTQILALADALDSMRNVSDNSGMSTSDKAYDLALNIFTDYFKLNGVENVTKQMKKQIEDYKIASEKMYKQILDNQKKESKAELDRLRNELKLLEADRARLAAAKTLDTDELEHYDMLLKIERKQSANYEETLAQYDKYLDKQRKRILKLKADIEQGKIDRKSARLKAAESRQKTVLRNRIKSIVHNLSKMVTNPTEGSHVPVGLVNATIDVLQTIDLNTGKSVNMAEKLRKLSDKYQAIQKGYEDNVNPDYDATLEAMINQLRKTFEGRSIAKLTQSELEEVFKICAALQTQIRNTNKLINTQLKEDIYEAGQSIIDDVRAAKGVGDGKIANMANRYLTASVNAERFFNRISGYKEDSTLNKLYEELNEGSHKMMEIEFEVSDIMKDVLEGSENQKLADKFKGDSLKDWVDTPFKDNNGNTIRVPQSFRASLALHMMNEQNLKHILYGGLTLPNEKLYHQGNIVDAYARGNIIRPAETQQMRKIYKQIRNTETVDERIELWKKYNELQVEAEKVGLAKLQDMVDSMTPYEKAWVENAKKYFHEYSGKKINETSLKLNGYAKAVVDNYFPIKSDPSFTRSEMEGLKLDSTIEGWGNLKERTNGKNPIVLEGLDNVLNGHSKMLAKYAGMAIPIRNFNKVYNVTLAKNADSVKKAIKEKFGERSNKFISDLFTDLQMGRPQTMKAFSALRGAHAASTLTLNIPVTYSQAASYPTAAAELGWDALGHALGSKAGANWAKEFVTFFNLSRTTQDIMATAEKYTPLLKYRNLGNSTQELGDLKNKRTWIQKKSKVADKVIEKSTNWIQNMDVTTVATLWKASEYRVAKDNPNLKPGTDEFYKEVAKVFNKVVERTQPNYTVLQRPDILRSNNELIKFLTMYKTQPLQNLGILIDSTGNLNAKARAYKADPTAENEAKYKKAKKQFARAVSSQVVAACTFVGMRAIANAILHRLNPFRDDDDELTLESIMKRYWQDVGSSMAGSLIGGSEIYDFMNALINKERWYGLNVSVTENITNIGNDIYNLYNADTLSEQKAKLKKLITDTSVLTGVPVGNMEKLYDAFRLHAEDIKNGEFLSFEAGVDRSTKVENHRMYEAMKEGNWDKFDKLYAEEDPDKVTKGTTSVTSLIKEDYVNGKISEEEAETYLQEIGFSKDDAHFKIQDWNHADEEGGSSDYIEVYDAIDSYDTKAIVNAVNELKKYGYDNEKLQKTQNITKQYKDKYIELYNTNKTEAANLKSAILTYYQACGKSREEASKKVDNWVK